MDITVTELDNWKLPKLEKEDHTSKKTEARLRPWMPDWCSSTGKVPNWNHAIKLVKSTTEGPKTKLQPVLEV